MGIQHAPPEADGCYEAIHVKTLPFYTNFKTALDYTVTVQFKIYAGVLKKEFFHKKSCRKDDIVC